MAVMNLNIFSMALRYSIDCTVVLPEKIEKDEKLKCIWLYHGGSGDNKEWLYNTSLTKIVEKEHFAAILPNVFNSCFVNMNIGDKFASFVGKELPSVIWNMFNCISDKREDNYIVGYSNGGYGCLHTVLLYPEKFIGVGAFSAGDKADSEYLTENKIKSKKLLFGEGDLHNTPYCLTYLADKLIQDKKEKIFIYHACGENDPWLDKNHIIKDYFQNHSDFEYYYDEQENFGHEWDFWEMELKEFIKFIKNKKLK